MSFNNPNQVHVGRDAINVTEGNQYNYAYNVNSDAETLRKLSDAEALRILAQNAAPNACYDSEQRFPPPNCHEGTRLQILQKLSSRIEDKSKANSVLWLHGSAGVGKSAIAQHLAEKYARSGRLGAAFFFSRSDSTRDKIRPLVASIAYQFCKPGSPFHTTLGPAIIDTIRSDPNIFYASCENQAKKLVTELSSELHTAVTKEQEIPPYLIIVDGLDECIARDEQERALEIVLALISCSSSYFSWIILLCSHPEPQIRHGFGHEGFERYLESFDVNSLDDVNRDIHRYIVDNFATLRTKYRYALGRKGPSWPGQDVIRKLVARADGQFIFAATVLKYLDVDYEPPQDRLDTILRIYAGQGESPYSPLDMLYHQILLGCHKWEKVQPLLRLLCTPHHPPPDKDPFHSTDTLRPPLYDSIYMPRLRSNHRNESISKPKQWRSSEMLTLLLNLKVHEVFTLLIRLHSVLGIPEGNSQEENIDFVHATFPEFLADPNRSGPFYTPAMSESEYCDCVATLLLRTLAAFTPSYPLYNLESFGRAKQSWFLKFTAAHWLVAFSCHWWSYYCSKVNTPSEDLLGELENMDVHVVVAMSLQLDSRLPFDWDGVIEWAKVVFRSFVNNSSLTNRTVQALGDSRIDAPVEKLKMMMMEVHIALGCSDDYVERQRIFRGIFSTEQWLLCRDIGAWSFQDAMFERLRMPSQLLKCDPVSFNSLYAGSGRSSSLRNIFIVPRDITPKVSNTVPVVRVTRENFHVFRRIYGALKYSDPWYMSDIDIRLLLGYVADRKLTITDYARNPVRFPEDVLEQDLLCFAGFFKERLAVLDLDFEWSKGSFWLVDAVGQGNTCDVRGDSTSSPTANKLLSGTLKDSHGLNNQQSPSSPSSLTRIGPLSQETSESDRTANAQQSSAPEGDFEQPVPHSQVAVRFRRSASLYNQMGPVERRVTLHHGIRSM